MIDANEAREITRASREAAEKILQEEFDKATVVICNAITSEAKKEFYFAHVYIGDGLFLAPDKRPAYYIEVAPSMVEPLVDRLAKGLQRLQFVVCRDEIQLNNVKYTQLEISWWES